MDFRKNISELEFRYFAFGVDPGYQPQEFYKNLSLWLDGPPRTVYHPQALKPYEAKMLPSEAKLKAKYKRYGYLLFIKHWLKADLEGFPWPELDKHRYLNRWFAWWRWDHPELRRQIKGPQIIDIQDSVFGVPTVFRTEEPLTEKTQIWYESQSEYLLRNSRMKPGSKKGGVGMVFESEVSTKILNRVKSIEQIFPERKLL